MSVHKSLPPAIEALSRLDVPAETAVRREPVGSTVAVVVPTPNDSRFLADALESVRRQTHPHLRCVVVDDASSEASWPVVKRFADNDARFTYLRHGRNAGLAAARNTALTTVIEDFVQFLDADDMLTPNALESRLAALTQMTQTGNHTMIAGSYGRVAQCPEETSLDEVTSWAPQQDLPPMDWIESDGECPFNVHAVLVRTSVLASVGGFDESYVNGAEDWELWMRLLRHGYVFAPCRDVVGAYRLHRTSMTRAHSSMHLARADELLTTAHRWATVDPSVAVSPANMPLPLARDAYRRMVRAARWAGIRAVQCDSIDEAIDDSIISFVPPGTAVASRRPHLITAAKGGVLRGLGLGFNTRRLLPAPVNAKIHATATAIADTLLDTWIQEIEPPPPDSDPVDLVRHVDPDVALLAETAADVAVLIDIARRLEASGKRVAAIDVDYVKGDEGATAAWTGHEIDQLPVNAILLGRSRPRVVVARKPSSAATLDLLASLQTVGTTCCWLSEPARACELPQARSAQADLKSASVSDLLALLDDPAFTPDRSPLAGPAFLSALRREESEIDAASVEKLRALHNLHEGETAVIVGNGPSLNDTDLSLLSRAPFFAVNSIFLAEDRLPAPPTYYVVEDKSVFAENTQAIKDYKVGTRLFPHIYRRHFKRDEVDANTIFFRMNLGFYGRNSGTLAHPRFSVDASQRVYCGQSVTIVNLQLAYWMGFKRVVLIGMDFSYVVPDDADVDGIVIKSNSDDPNHFHPDYFGPGKTWKDPKLDRVLANYSLAKEMYEADRREIINATVGGKLELFDRMSLADALPS
jgi:glycosyltransferase involved in cell wall biosynthesis